MGLNRRKRTAWATGLSLALHVLMLTGMVVGLKVVAPPEEDRAVELTLVRPLVPPPPKPVSVTPQPKTSRPAPSLSPRSTPQPPATVPTVAAPPAPAPAPAPPPREVAGPFVNDNGFKGSVTGRMGCDDPLQIHLTDAQKQVCANNLVQRAKEAKDLGLAMAAAKEKEFDHERACHRAYTAQGTPRSDEGSDIGIRSIVGNRMPKGLGSSPSLKECGPGDR